MLCPIPRLVRLWSWLRKSFVWWAITYWKWNYQSNFTSSHWFAWLWPRSQRDRRLSGVYVCGCLQGIEINSSYCGEVEQNGPLVGSIPLESSPLMVFPATRLTAVALTSVGDQTVAFLGTSRGHVRKVSETHSPSIATLTTSLIDWSFDWFDVSVINRSLKIVVVRMSDG